MLIPPVDINKIVLDQMVAYYMHTRKLTGRKNCNAVYEVAEFYLPVWRGCILEQTPTSASADTMQRIEEEQSELIAKIMTAMDSCLTK